MPIESEGTAPYAPAQTVIDLIEGYRNRGYATPFGSDVMRKAGIPESLINRTLQALRLLDLTDEKNEPTEQFRLLKQARGDEEYKARLSSWLSSTYADILRYADPRTDDIDKVTTAFWGCKPEGQRPRMVTLMLGLFAYAGIIEEGPKKTSSNKPKASNGNPRPKNSSEASKSKKQKTGEGDERAQAVAGTELVTAPASVAGLLRDLPSAGESWTTEQRDKWWKTFEVILDYAYPIDNNVLRSTIEAAIKDEELEL